MFYHEEALMVQRAEEGEAEVDVESTCNSVMIDGEKFTACTD